MRYADDIAIFVSSQRSAERVKESVIAWIEKHLKVEVNRDKSGRGPSDQSGLLGFRLYADGRIGVAPKTVERLKGKVRELWDGRQSLTSEQLRDQWQRYIRGWWNYCELTDWRREVTAACINRRMRKTARLVVWKGRGAQSPRLHPIISNRLVPDQAGLPLCKASRRRRASSISFFSMSGGVCS